MSQLQGHMGGSTGPSEATLRGGLAILHAMCVVCLHGGEVAATWRDAGLFLGSLGKFQNSAVGSIDEPLDQKRAYWKITHVFETARRRRDQGVQVDQGPLHHRHTGSLVIKGGMKRGLESEGVYPDVCDGDWK